jgi:hypothetical protein
MKTLNPLFYLKRKAAPLHLTGNEQYDQDLLSPNKPDAPTQGKNLMLL